MQIVDFMNQEVVTVSPETSVRDAIRLLEDLEIRHLPVLRGKRLAGILSDRDIRGYRAQAWLGDADDSLPMDLAHDVPVSEIMSENVVFADTREDIGTAARLMVEHRIGALPVVDYESGELAGIISYVDILRVAADLM